MNIVLCDDNSQALKKNASIIDQIFVSRGLHYNLHSFNSGEELVRHFRQLLKTDLFILDQKMSGMSGMEVAKAIRDQGIDSTIIFISSFVDAAPQGYSLGVHRYILKNEFLSDNLLKELSAIVDDYLKPTKILSLFVNRKELQIPVQHIMYVEGQNKKIVVHLAHGAKPLHPAQYEFYSYVCNLAQISDKLSTSNFLKVQRTYIVNLDYVTDVVRFAGSTFAIRLKNGVELPISRDVELRKKIKRWLACANI